MTKTLLLFLLLIPINVYPVDDFQIPTPPFPPQPQNKFLDRLNITCTKEGYSWEWKEGPDFDLYYFNNIKSNNTKVGFYIGYAPAYNRKNSLNKKRARLGKLNKHSVVWTKRLSPDSDGYLLETLVPLYRYKNTELIKYLHFWLIIQNEKNENEWLDWIKCFEIEQDATINLETNDYDNTKTIINLKYKGTVEKKRLFDDKPEKYYLFEISK